MKRFVVAGLAFAFAVSVMLPGVSYSAGYNENTGCGLGNQLFKEIGQDSVLFQVLAVTVNQTILFNQVFGITSGTLGCKQPTKLVENEKLNKFVADNMDSLAQDMATGRGESLETLAELMGVPAEKKPEFFASLQANFTNIYTSEKVVSADVIDNIASIN